MSTVPSSTQTPPPAQRGAASPSHDGAAANRSVGLGRLTAIKLRKAVDTKAGAWLLGIMSVLSLVVVVLVAILAHGDKSFGLLLNMAFTFTVLVTPILGIMSATQEWSQRTGLTTFTLVPRRGRVVAAKVLASFVLGLIVAATMYAACALVTLLTGGTWHLGIVPWWGPVLGLIIVVLEGAGFGLALLNTPLAIVASLVLPTVLQLLGSIGSLSKVVPWIDLNSAVGRMMTSSMLGGTAPWGHLGVAALVWVVAPIAFGAYRVMTREVK